MGASDGVWLGIFRVEWRVVNVHRGGVALVFLSFLLSLCRWAEHGGSGVNLYIEHGAPAQKKSNIAFEVLSCVLCGLCVL